MPTDMQAATSKLRSLLDAHPPTAGLCIRVQGANLILGRAEATGPLGQKGHDDRVRFTKLSAETYGLSVRRHTGRWERTPFVGSLEEMVETILACMQHLVAPF